MANVDDEALSNQNDLLKLNKTEVKH